MRRYKVDFPGKLWDSLLDLISEHPMAGDRGLAIVIIGLIGASFLWKPSGASHEKSSIIPGATQQANAIQFSVVPLSSPALDLQSLAAVDAQNPERDPVEIPSDLTFPAQDDLDLR